MTRKMKDSGVEWIGEIPEGWNLSKIGSVYKERSTKVSDKDFKPLSVTKNGVVNQLENAAKTDNGDNRKLVKKNDFVINSRSDRRGSCGISSCDGSVSLINIVLEPRNQMSNLYYNYVFKSEEFADEFYRWGNGIVNDLWSTKWSSMKRIYIPYPYYEQQEKIANYLDKKCNKIDQTIEKEKQVIEKLKEYKQSVITEAVTKGLNPHVKMKDSGVEWIGEIPEHWGIKALKYSIEYNKYNLSEKTDDKLNIRYIDIGSVTNEDGIKEIQNYTFDNAPSRARRIVKKGDTIISTVRTYLKAIAYISDEYDGFICSTGFAVCTPKDCYIDKYMFYCLHAEWFVSIVESISVGISYPAINTTNLMNLKNIVPPIEEQKEIADYLDKKCSSIDKLILNKEQLIEKLTEYKKSLIYECVTGKREV